MNHLHDQSDPTIAAELLVANATLRRELSVAHAALVIALDERHALNERVAERDSALAKTRAAERMSRHRAHYDAVTNLPNFTLFSDRLGHALEQARRHQWRLAVMFIDLDDFKGINDTHGHDVGDSVLRGVADRLQASVRAGDTVGRRAGDEFLFLMPEVRDDAAVTDLAKKILEGVAAPLDVEGLTLSVRPSIGYALFPDDGQSESDLLKCADFAMYAAKQNKLGVLRYRVGMPV